ncbi:MAG: hypothetical protein M1822_008330 [Bathelium mastoideum]|nr:MAG: hypothetical protein M1822_008330 [Bathelium mastoideum]
MSITTRSTPPEPPPLLFGRRSSSPPPPIPFPSDMPGDLPPPPSSGRLIDIPSDLPPPPPLSSDALRLLEEEDVDMDVSMTLPPPVQGQNHDRNMQQGNDPNDSAIANGDLQLPETSAIGTAPVQPAEGPPSVDNVPSAGFASAPPQHHERLVRVSSNGDVVESDGDDDLTPPLQPRPHLNPALESIPVVSIHGTPPPPPPPPPPPEDQEMSDGEEDNGTTRWRPLPEDDSSPNEIELKEIESKVEHSAHDHEHWEKQTYLNLEDPEYTPAASGRIEWLVNNYNGTKEKPNQEVVMRSPAVRIGDFDWQIKFYPKGNDSEYLSIYIECISLVADTDKQSGLGNKEGKERSALSPASGPDMADRQVACHRPLQVLECGSHRAAKERRSVAAQFSIVLYNPQEPRVNHFHCYSHRFCPNSPDWGTTRFHGPCYRICYREPFERQALLRNDTLAFTAYVRTIEDTTGCLWEHSSDSNPWDSLTMTGLHSLSSPTSSEDGNVMAAISSWMLLLPFRELLYNIQAPDPLKDARKRPMPLIEELQHLLFQMRQPRSPRTGKIALQGVIDKLNFYGLGALVQRMDVIEIWEVLRAKLEEELEGTPWSQSLYEIFGPAKDHVRGTPHHRIRVKGHKTIKDALASAEFPTLRPSPTSSVICFDLDRQVFDPQTRRWKKIMDRISFDDRISINGECYILYGHISHRGELQSGSYYSTLRPLGGGSRWYRYNNRSSDCKVTCITQREASQEEGSSSKSSRDVAKSVAYIVMYVREPTLDLTQMLEPAWTVPVWLSNLQFESVSPKWDILDLRQGEFTQVKRLREDRQKADGPATVDLQVIDSRAFESSQNAGIVDLFEIGCTDLQSKPLPTLNISMPASATLGDVQEHLKRRLPVIKDRQQCVLFLLDSRKGSWNWPRMYRWRDHPQLSLNLGVLSELCPEKRMWLHVIPQASLHKAEPPDQSKHQSEGAQATPTAITNDDSSPTAQEVPDSYLGGGDSPMSEADDSESVADVSMTHAFPNNVLVSEPSAVSLTQVPGPPSNGSMEAPITVPIDSDSSALAEQESHSNPAPEAVMEDSSVLPVANPAPPPASADASDDLSHGVDPTRLEMISDIAMRLDYGMVDQLYAISPGHSSIRAEIYVFLKIFDVSTQTVKHVSSHVVGAEERLEVISQLLELNKPVDLFEETHMSCPKLNANRTFRQEGLRDGAVLIAREQVTDQAKYLTQGCHVDPADYLKAQTVVRNFPHLSSCHLTQSYFSSSYFQGSVSHGQPHGLGEHISLGNNEAYRGDFALGRRHGHGRLTYANGDVYEGAFEHGLPNGKGVLVEQATGNEYSGGWKNGKRHGQGVTIWKQAEDESGRRCKICWEGDADSAFLHCGHVAACMECAQNLDDCPVCRGRVAGVVKLYFVS